MIIYLLPRDEDSDPVSVGSVVFWLAGSGSIFFHLIRIRILPVTTDLLSYFHLEQNINQNQQIQA